MSESGHTLVVAQIKVTGAGTPPTVTCTQKVKSGLGVVVWHVHNASGTDLTNVEVKNFTPATQGIEDLQIRSGAFGDLGTGKIPDGQKRVIVGTFHGDFGTVYDYEIWVDAKLATDPQLEI